uniref:Uncharacterized protein n=1 Tax=Cacopsylla melanoneura TaxID=428564 RepID=A0A8D9EAV1_9HEMI
MAEYLSRSIFRPFKSSMAAVAALSGPTQVEMRPAEPPPPPQPRNRFTTARTNASTDASSALPATAERMAAPSVPRMPAASMPWEEECFFRPKKETDHIAFEVSK